MNHIVGKSFRCRADTRSFYHNSWYGLLPTFFKNGLSRTALDLLKLSHFSSQAAALMLPPELSLVPTFGILFCTNCGVHFSTFVSSAATVCFALPGSTVLSTSTSMKTSSVSPTAEVVSCC